MESASSFQCPACGDTRATMIGPTHGGFYGRCRSCGVEAQIAQDGAAAGERFRAAQASCYGEQEGLDLPSVRRFSRYLAAVRMRIIRRHLPRGRLLEVGPGSGEFLELAQSYGYELDSIEHSPVQARRLSERIGITVSCGMFEEMDLSGRTYDGVVSSHVIEHVPDPLRHMSAARAAVAPGGYFFLATPNLKAWSRRIAGSRWPGYTAGHLCLFDASSLTRWLGQAGWKVVDVYTNEGAWEWPWVLLNMRRKPRGVRSFEQSAALIRKTPYAVTSAIVSAIGIFSWPLRRLQNTLGAGYDLMVVAQAEA